MGKARPLFAKKLAEELLKSYPEKFSSDFEKNKKALNEFSDKIPSKPVRNWIAGIITRKKSVKAA